ncbi:MAG: glycosyl hydrolase family 18 protein [bacterium]|nr:glycosyl hydrolase family 18 protein [bacterium]
MEKKQKQMIASILAILLVVIIAAIAIFQKITPSKETKELSEYYEVKDDEILIFMENSLYEEKGLYINNKIYLEYDTVINEINKRFYWDSVEKILSVTTPKEIIKVQEGASSYLVNKSTEKTEYPIVKLVDDKVYVAIDFVKMYSNVEYETFLNPNRVVINCHWGEQFQYAQADKDVSVRTSPSIKSPILTDVKAGGLFIYAVSEREEVGNGFVKVMTEDGIIGYVRSKYLMDSYYVTLENDYKAPEYTSITKDKKINMVWHQVFSNSGQDKLDSLLSKTKGVNVISPTWFNLKNNNGEITSLASEAYIEKAHKKGIEVWALINDIDNKGEIDLSKLLGRTSSREKLSNELIAEAISKNIDGINLDFEKITADTAKAYLQFVRELSVKCRNNGIVLSIDNYTPEAYNTFYDIKEQGIVADYVIIMAYDEHYAGSEESGSVSSVGFVQNALTNTVQQVSANKVIMALPFYTRLWKEVNNGDGVKITSEAYSMVNAATLMQDKGVTLEWNEEVGQYYGQYKEGSATYKMWLEDEKSYELKLKTAFSQDIAGVSAWKLGLESSDIWNAINNYVKK